MNGEDKIFCERRLTILETKLEEGWKSHDREAKIRQDATCKKLDIIVKEVSKINERCFDRTESYVLMDKHIKDEGRLKSIWSDRRFQAMLGIMAGGFILMGVMITALIQ